MTHGQIAVSIIYVASLLAGIGAVLLLFAKLIGKSNTYGEDHKDPVCMPGFDVQDISKR